jgi:hypothetical protein
MTQEQFEEMKEMYLNNIKRYINETGGLFPHVTIFATKVEAPDEIGIIHIPIPKKLMDSEAGKEKFVGEVIPEIGKDLKKMFDPKAVLWASEAWMRDAGKDFDPAVTDYKTLPVKYEVLIITIDRGEGTTQTLIYKMIRTNMKVNKDGDMIDQVKLEPYKENEGMTSGNGRFTGLFNKLVTA